MKRMLATLVVLTFLAIPALSYQEGTKILKGFPRSDATLIVPEQFPDFLKFPVARLLGMKEVTQGNTLMLILFMTKDQSIQVGVVCLKEEKDSRLSVIAMYVTYSDNKIEFIRDAAFYKGNKPSGILTRTGGENDFIEAVNILTRREI